MEDKCLRCSRCCYFNIEGKIHKCKFLRGKLCSIYHNKDRIGKIIFKSEDKIIKCFNRVDCPNNFKGCPYNKESWPEREVGF